MKRPRKTEDESVLHEINKASDAIRKKYKLLLLLEEFVFLTNSIASLVDFMKHLVSYIFSFILGFVFFFCRETKCF